MGVDGQPEVLGAVPPVQNMRLLGRIVPVDQRLRRPVGVNSSVFGRPRAVFGMLCSVQTSYLLRRPH